ncbi:FadR/GntR family transcriptional regulator [Lacibacterium aquatile]|uniref:FadR/GntR family transcriptional regulator n=1 Tax=Lacibacterium aquatile TaxID=1168082 RepID=A0ABW5DTF0_9PROT
MAELKRRETLASQLVKVLADRVGGGSYKLGEKLPSEQELINEFGVSRTVVREAIATLKAGGMITTQQGIGAFVTQSAGSQPFRVEEASLDLVNEVRAVLELRIGLEAEAASLAALRRDDRHLERMVKALERMEAAISAGTDAVEPDLDFHRAIAEATFNVNFLNLFNYLGAMLIPRTRIQTFRLHEGSREEYLQRVNREHHDVYMAIRRRDPEAARAAMRVHLTGSRERLTPTEE